LDAWDREGGSIYEIKSHSEDEFGKEFSELNLWPVYAFQISVYMHATNKPLKLVRVLRDKEGNVNEYKVEEFSSAPRSMDEIRRRVFQVEMLARKELGEVECEKVEFPCPFFYTHSGRDKDERELVEDDGAVVLAGQYMDARVAKMQAEGRFKASRVALLEWMGDRRKVELPSGVLLTRYTIKGGRVEYDRKEYENLKVTARRGEDGGEGGGEGEGDATGSDES